jgi:RimJ/RimL family protein N-acetyltransferase
MRRVKARPEPRTKTSGLHLRGITEADHDDVVAGIGDLAVSWMLARVPHPYTQRDADAFFAYARGVIARGTMLYVGIADRDRIVGALSIEGIPGRPVLGYWLARSHWGNGIMPRATAAVIGHAFDTLGIRVVRSGAFTDNPRSLRVQEKLGFRRIGRRRMRSLARGTEVEHIDTVLTPALFRERLR